MKCYKVKVGVEYTGTVTVHADNMNDAKEKIRQWVKPQGVFIDPLFGEDDDYKFALHPTVKFGNFREIRKGRIRQPRRIGGSE